MSKTNRQFKGKAYRQGQEPAELDLTRIRAEKRTLRREAGFKPDMRTEMDLALKEAALDEQKLMGY